jgi:hypothetical protein
MPNRRRRLLILGLALIGPLGVATGCQNKYANIPVYQPSTQPLTNTGLADSQGIEAIKAVVKPPVGWHLDPVKESDGSLNYTWKSPTGKTAFGVIHFGMPFPVPTWVVYPNVIQKMKEHEGEANVITGPLKDENLPGMRFTVDTGDYRMRSNLITKGFSGWIVYAGTLRNDEEVPAELELAEKSREKTRVGTHERPADENGPKVTRPTASASE